MLNSDNGPTGIWNWPCRLKICIKWQPYISFILSVLSWHWTGHMQAIQYIMLVTLLSFAPCILSLLSQHLPPRQKSKLLVWPGSWSPDSLLSIQVHFLTDCPKVNGKNKDEGEGWDWLKSVFQICNPKSNPTTLYTIYTKGSSQSTNMYIDHILPLKIPHQPTLLLLNTVALSHDVLSYGVQIEPHNTFQYGVSSSHN